jgi:negative regulator of sigma E activity
MSEQGKGDGPKLVTELKASEFEEQLARALRRVEAPEGFAVRVMERVSANPTHDDGAVMNGAPETEVSRVVMMQPRRGMWRMQAWMGGAVAAVLALGVFGAEQVHQRREQARANEQFAVAVSVTDRALAQTREQLQRAGLKLSE